MSIRLTQAALRRVTSFLATDPHAVALRFGVKRTGCSGFSYTVDLATTIAENDQVFEQDGVKVVVDAATLPLVDGTEIDYARQGINSAFVFRNPNVAGACGCGESFTV